MKRYMPFKLLSIIFVLCLVSMLSLLFLSPAPPLLTGTHYSQVVYSDRQQLLRITLSSDGKYRVLTPLSAISPYIQAATLLEEDQYFYYHPGINPVALAKATWHSYVFGPRRMGASTITMQLARIRYGINSKSLSGKILQIIRALQIEAHYDKKQILEAYLNLAPYGNNIEGVSAASWVYFGKSPQQLSLPEALTLVVIPQNPNKRVPDRGVLQRIRQKLFLRWLALHPEARQQQALMQLPLQIRSLHSLPFIAPHFVNQLLANKPTSRTLNSTLNIGFQSLIEHVTRQFIARKNNLGVKNAAVLLIDTRDMGVKAMLGSSDFFNINIGGQINGTEIKRSPGSTLKPFIYALAIDQGLIHPATILKDVPHRFGRYNPENFDNDFAGPIKAHDALTLSRNIPAIYLAQQLQQPSLYEFLQQAGVVGLQPESYYGLALVLGGAELTMHDLASFYAMLANEGIYQPLKFLQDAPPLPKKRLLSAEASFLVLDMLKETTLPDTESLGSKWQALPIAWKTGTSSAYRDAWTIGVVGPYVLAVWVGNFNNQSNPVFIGKEIAAPLFFEIAYAINSQYGPLPVLPKSTNRLHLQKVAVCKVSGMLPTRYCPETEQVWFIPGKSPIKTDTVHREIAINNQTGLRACRFDQNTRFEVDEFWSSDLLKIFQRAGMQRRTPPAFDPSCSIEATIQASHANQGFAPQIVSPQAQVNYVARVGSLQNTVIPLTAIVDADVKNLYWFAGETYLGKTARTKTLFWHARPGNVVIRVVDDFGRSDARNVKIEVD